MFDGLHSHACVDAGQYATEAYTVPAVTDPIEILFGLEERLEHCEEMVQDQLAQVQRRLEKLERDVDALKGGDTTDIGALERQVAALADRLFELEESAV